MTGASLNPDPRRCRVICVDDDPGVLSALRRALRHGPCEVVTTQSPEQALRLMEDGRPSMVISDLRMPGMDGEELLRQVRARHPQAGRLMLTAYPDVASAFLRGAGEVLAKPWNDDELRNRVWERFRAQAEDGSSLSPGRPGEASSLLSDLERAMEDGRRVPGDPAPGADRTDVPPSR